MSKPIDGKTRSRQWCFTINNYTETDKDQVLTFANYAKYTIVGIEIGEKGTPHYQGYMYFKDAKSFSLMKKKLTRAHIELPIASHQDNIDYCGARGKHVNKPGWQSLLIEQGDPPTQGERTDIEQVREELKTGANMRQVIDHASSLQSIQFAQIWLKYNEPVRKWRPEVRWYHGSTGSGKSYSAKQWLGYFEDSSKVYKANANLKWWDGYDAHENVWIDEFRAHKLRFSELLELLDENEFRVEVKNGFRQMLAKRIAITSPYHPSEVYNNHEDKEQLIRRIGKHNIILCGKEVKRHECLIRDIDSDDELDRK